MAMVRADITAVSACIAAEIHPAQVGKRTARNLLKRVSGIPRLTQALKHDNSSYHVFAKLRLLCKTTFPLLFLQGHPQELSGYLSSVT